MRSTAEDANAISRKSQTRGDTGSNRDFRFLGRSLHAAGSLKILRDSSDPSNSSQHPKPFIRITPVHPWEEAPCPEGVGL